MPGLRSHRRLSGSGSPPPRPRNSPTTSSRRWRRRATRPALHMPATKLIRPDPARWRSYRAERYLASSSVVIRMPRHIDLIVVSRDIGETSRPRSTWKGRFAAASSIPKRPGHRGRATRDGQLPSRCGERYECLIVLQEQTAGNNRALVGQASRCWWPPKRAQGHRHGAHEGGCGAPGALTAGQPCPRRRYSRRSLARRTKTNQDSRCA